MRVAPSIDHFAERVGLVLLGSMLASCNLVPPAPSEPAPHAAARSAESPAKAGLGAVAPGEFPAAAPAHAHKPPAETPGAPEGVRRFGKPIHRAEPVTLAAVAGDPRGYNRRVIVTEGTVTKVCQEAGCWMALRDGAHNAVVRMENHAFFLPKDAAGQKARVEGRLLLVKDGKECDEAEAEHAELSMEASGVELAAR